MPTYDYRCKACGHEFELFQQMSDPVKKKCPQCSTLKLERLIGTGAGVLFKGSGFYETDYRSDSYKKAAEAEKKAAEPKKDDSKKSTSGGGCACGSGPGTCAGSGNSSGGSGGGSGGSSGGGSNGTTNGAARNNSSRKKPSGG